MLGQLRSADTSHGDNRSLRAGVGDIRRAPKALAGDGRDIHDSAFFALCHLARHGLHTEKDALGIHRMNPVPVCLGDIKKPQAFGHTGIIDQNINPAKGFHCGGDHGVDVFYPAHVGFDKQTAAVMGADLSRGLLAGDFIDFRAHDMSALFGTPQGNGLAHAGPNPGHDSNLLFEQHAVPPYSGLAKLRHDFPGKQLQALTRPLRVAATGVKIERYLIEAKFVVELVQPTTALGRGADHRPFFHIVRHGENKFEVGTHGVVGRDLMERITGHK